MLGRTRKDITIHRRFADHLPLVEGDRGQIQQALSNVCTNAAEAMPGKGHLSFETKDVSHKHVEIKVHDPRPGNYVLLEVSDTGTGMDNHAVARIFEPFFSTKKTGSGLGLAAAHGIIEGHGGYIDVRSKKGRGTTFSIYLPASEKDLTEEPQSSDELLKGTETILLVDDEAMFVEVGRDMLELMGYSVLAAKGGKEAVEIYEANIDRIDLVILDMIMPDMGGGETYDRMKEINPEVKVLLSTGYSIEGQAKEILDRGCDRFIQKPFTMKELSQSIRQVLETG